MQFGFTRWNLCVKPAIPHTQSLRSNRNRRNRDSGRKSSPDAEIPRACRKLDSALRGRIIAYSPVLSKKPTDQVGFGKSGHPDVVAEITVFSVTGMSSRLLDCSDHFS